MKSKSKCKSKSKSKSSLLSSHRSSGLPHPIRTQLGALGDLGGQGGGPHDHNENCLVHRRPRAGQSKTEANTDQDQEWNDKIWKGKVFQNVNIKHETDGARNRETGNNGEAGGKGDSGRDKDEKRDEGTGRDKEGPVGDEEEKEERCRRGEGGIYEERREEEGESTDEDEYWMNREIKECRQLYDNDQYEYFMDTIYGETSLKRRFSMKDCPLGMVELEVMKREERREKRNLEKGQGESVNVTKPRDDTSTKNTIASDLGLKMTVEELYRNVSLGRQLTGAEGDDVEDKPAYVIEALPPDFTIVSTEPEHLDEGMPSSICSKYRCRKWCVGCVLFVLVFSYYISVCSAARNGFGGKTNPDDPQYHYMPWFEYMNCSKIFPKDFLSFEVAENGGFLIHLVLAFFLFAGLTNVADSYFVPSIEVISEVLGLEPGVAGATLLAVGSSQLSLVISFLGIYLDNNDTGMKPIIGTTVYQLLISLGVCGLMAGYQVPLSPYNMAREMIFLFLAIFFMGGFLFEPKNGALGIVLVLVYLLYIVVILNNDRIMDLLQLKSVKKVRFFTEETSNDEKKSFMEMLAKRRQSHFFGRCETVDRSLMKSTEGDIERLGIPEEEAWQKMDRAGVVTHWSKTATAAPSQTTLVDKVDAAVAQEDILQSDENLNVDLSTVYSELCLEEGDEEKVYRKTTAGDMLGQAKEAPSVCETVFWIYSMPFAVLHFFTVPDVRKLSTWKFPLSFITLVISTCYITLYDYLLLMMINNFGNAVGIPIVLSRYTFMPLAMSVPLLYCATSLTRDGYGEMAVASILGSNIFNLLIGIGLPFLIDWGQIEHASQSSEAHAFFMMIIASTIILLMIIFRIFHWTLNRTNSVICLGMFFVIIAMQLSMECTLFLGEDKDICRKAGCMMDNQ